MSVTNYEILRARNPNDLASLVATAIAASWQPYGYTFLAEGDFCQPMVKGAPDTNSLAQDAAAVTNGSTVAVNNSAGADSHNAIAEVAANVLTDVKFAATVAMVDDTDTVVVHKSTGAVVAGTHTAEVALGVLTDVKLASTVATVVNGGTLTGVTPSGTFVTTITFTVASGAITAIALS